MRQAISEILPYAVGVAISPVPIIAVILMLFSNRAKTNGPAFLLGWVLGLGVVVAVAYSIADASNVATDSSASDGSSTVQVVLGVVLLVLALRNWRKRPGPGEEAAMPKWMATIDAFTPIKALGLAVLLSAVNPKNLILSIGAAAAVAQDGPTTSDATVALVVFVVLASLSIAVPVRLLPPRRREGEDDARRLEGVAVGQQRHRDGGAAARVRRRADRQGHRALLVSAPR